MAKNPVAGAPRESNTPLVAAALTGVIYNARLINREAKLSIEEEEIVSEVLTLWRSVRAELEKEEG